MSHPGLEAYAPLVIHLLVATALAGALTNVLPVPPVLDLYPGPLLLAATYGLLTALAFSLWPLGRAARTPGAALFRDALLPDVRRLEDVIVDRDHPVEVAVIHAGVAPIGF